MDDLVKRAREWNFCWPSHDVEMLVPAMADRIEELEAKLAKAVVFAEIVERAGHGALWPLALDILAELKGQNDE